MIGFMGFPDGYEPEWMEGMYAAKRIEDDLWLTCIPLIFGARVCVATPDNASIEHWCYNNGADIALRNWVNWPDPPTGWTRHFCRDHTHEYPEAG